ncbi:anthranilate synthase component I [Priestia endophytica]|uniref:anthranilate synthase component I n=1 Tax=Priestia endophytica TaxID=135735 RepID=UPI003D274763
MNTNFTSFLQASLNYRTIPITKTFLMDNVMPVDLFQCLGEEAIYLLESSDESSPWANYSFIGLNPFLYLKEQNGTFFLERSDGTKLNSSTCLNEAFELAKEYVKAKIPDMLLPFKGGAVGFLSYDSLSLFEKVPVHKENDLGMPAVHFSFCETIAAYDHKNKKMTLIHYLQTHEERDEEKLKELYDNGEAKIRFYVEKLKKDCRVAEPIIFSAERKEVDFSSVESSYTKEKFVEDVEKLKEYIRSGDIFQGVLSQRFKLKTALSGLEIYRILRLVNPSPYLFYIKLEDAEIIGSSPERLIQVVNGHLEIHPIAGTRRRGRTEEEEEKLKNEMLQDEKERAEHYMLVDLARNDIGRVARYGSVQTPVLMEVVTFSHVMHMISKVTGELDRKYSPIQALLAAFPAGTVSGAPKVRAMQILNEMEPVARNVYAGTVAYIDFDGNIDSCIAIRTIVLKDENAYVQAGAGVVYDSVPELEYKETKNKASALIHTINVAEEIYGKEGAKLHV